MILCGHCLREPKKQNSFFNFEAVAVLLAIKQRGCFSSIRKIGEVKMLPGITVTDEEFALSFEHEEKWWDFENGCLKPGAPDNAEDIIYKKYQLQGELSRLYGIEISF